MLPDTEPSWLVIVDRGATTMWKQWNGVDADGIAHDSLNHYAKGAVVSFLHRYVAGLAPLEPACRRFRFRPLPGGGITWAQTAHESPYGRIEVRCGLAAGDLTWAVTVPPGATAELTLPAEPSRPASSPRAAAAGARSGGSGRAMAKWASD